MEKMTLNQRKQKWDQENTTQISVKLQNKTDADILAFLAGKQKQTEVKKALRLLMEQEKGNEK